MTIAIAQRRGDEILLVADTKVSNEPQPRPDELPGRLKVVTFAERITAAFAGKEGPAYLAFRDARRAFRSGGAAAALDVLVASSSNGETDYLVAAHHGETTLWRIKNGVQLPIEDGDLCPIGTDERFRDLIDRARTETGGLLWNGRLRNDFINLMITGKHGEPSVGGVPIMVRAQPEGHRYLHRAAFYTYKLNIEWGRTTVQPMEQVYTGDGHFQLQIVPSEQSDVPVVGACLLQARKGYVYSPIERPQDPTPYAVDLLPGVDQWEGREREMYAALDAAIKKHVAAVAAL
jgi:hypothetical protein